MKIVIVLLGLVGLVVIWQWIRACSEAITAMSDTDWWLQRVYRDRPPHDEP